MLELDKNLKTKSYAAEAGTTACVVFITSSQIYCANSGDSRAVLCSNRKAIGLSEDHKPTNPGEKLRITKAGHFVNEERVDGELALSRALGDHQFKDKPQLPAEQQAVTPFPDVSIRQRSGQDNFIIVACDGIWDVLNNDQCVAKLNKLYSELKPNNSNICPPVEKMLDECCPDTIGDGAGTDNMTAIFIRFK